MLYVVDIDTVEQFNLLGELKIYIFFLKQKLYKTWK